MAAAVVAAAVTYGIYAVHRWQGTTPLDQLLAAFGRADSHGLAGADRVLCGRSGHRRARSVAGPPVAIAADLRPGRGLLRLDRDRVLRLAESGRVRAAP